MKKRLGGFVASKMNISYIINEMTHSLRRQHIISSFTGQVPDAAFFFRAPFLVEYSEEVFLHLDDNFSSKKVKKANPSTLTQAGLGIEIGVIHGFWNFCDINFDRLHFSKQTDR